MINKINNVNYIKCNFKEVLLLHNEAEFNPAQATSELLSDCNVQVTQKYDFKRSLTVKYNGR